MCLILAFPILDVETLRAPTAYPPHQLAAAFTVAHACHTKWRATRFLYLEEPHG